MKTHSPWRAIGWRTRIRIWAESLEGGRPPLRSIDEFTAEYKRRIERTLRRHLAAGGCVSEGPRHTCVWYVGCRKFIPEYNNAKHIAEHITNRVTGFGWDVTMHHTKPTKRVEYSYPTSNNAERMSSRFTLCDDGTEDYEDTEWDDKSDCECDNSNCPNHGKVADFTVAGLDDLIREQRKIE